MVVGVIDHATGTRDIRRLAWLGQRSRPLLIIAVGATASMAALPPFLGFVAKEADFETVAHAPSLGGAARLSCSQASRWARCSPPSTACGSLWERSAARGDRSRASGSREMHRPPATFLAAPARSWPPRVWCSALWPAGLDDVLDTYADTVPGGESYDLALWHGLGAAAAVVGTGACRSARRRTSAAPRLRTAGAPSANRSATPTASTTPCCEVLDLVSVRLTAFTQRGSIPATQSVILSTLVLVPVIVLALGARDRPDFALWDSAAAGGGRAADPGRGTGRDRDAQPAGRGAARRRHRLRLRHDLRVPRCTRPGADPVPRGDTDFGDLRAGAAHAARRKPTERNINRYRLPRAALALAVGATVTTLAVYAMAARTGTPIAELLPDAGVFPRTRRQHRQRAAGRHPGLGHHGRDLGAAGRRHRRRVNGVPAQAFWRRAARLRCGQPDIGRLPTSHSPAVGDVTWLRGSELRDPRHRSLVLEVATR